MAAAASGMEEEEEEEAWLMDSLRLYNDLHLFELPGSTRVIEWTGDHAFVSLDTSTGAGTKFCSSFCLRGCLQNKIRAYVRREILRLKGVESVIAPSSGSNMSREPDTQHESPWVSVNSTDSTSSLSGAPSEGHQILMFHGTEVRHYEADKLLVTSGPPDSALQVWRVESDETDMIKLLSVISPTKTEDISWSKIATSCVKPACILYGQRIGNLQMMEIESGQNLWVAGFDGTVQVYNTKDWGSSGQEAKPVFIHKGHIFGTPGKDGGSPVVTTHTWHPWKPQTLLSAASDGSLHVWDWSDPLASEPV